MLTSSPEDFLHDAALAARLFPGGGEMGQRIRELDWSTTLLGPVAGWPQSLRTAVRIMLASHFPMMVHWGPELVHFYNDGYAAILQDKHPGALGQPAQPWWGEIWSFLTPIFERVRAGETTYFENQLVEPNRQGFIEEVYFTFSHSPLYDEADQIAGILATAIETTSTVINERRLAMLSHLTALTALSTQPEEAVQHLIAALSTNPADVPFALLYTHEAAAPHAHLQAWYGLPAGEPTAPATVAVAPPSDLGWPIADVLRQESPVLVPSLAARFNPWPADDWPEAPIQALLLPLPVDNGSEQTTTVLIVGLSARRPWDEAYRSFFGLVAEYAGRGLTHAAATYTAQRRAQERQDLYHIFEQAPVAIALLRAPDHRIDYFNPAFQQLFPADRLPGRTLKETYPDFVARGTIAHLDQVYTTGKTYTDTELPLVVPAGLDDSLETRYFNLIYQAYREQGLIAGVAAFFLDVTAQVLLQQQREAQQAELERLFEQAPFAIAILRGPTFVVELANAAMGQIWGPSSAHVLSRPYFEAIPEAAAPGLEQILTNVLTTGTAFFVTEAPISLVHSTTGLPEQGYVNFGFHPLYGENGHVSGVIAIGIEATEQVQARQRVQALNEELHTINEHLQRTNADLDTFVYTASHDLKAPITNIEGLLHMLQAELPVEQRNDTVEYVLTLIQDAIERFRTTLSHLTEVTRLQEGVEPAEAVDLGSLIEGVQLDLAPLLAVTPAQIDVVVTDCALLQVPAKTLRSVIYNLLSNALKYQHPERLPHIVIRCQQNEQEVELSVEDNGLGIDLEHQTELFGMFRRYHTHVDGAGVGLYMVKRMVEQAGGHVAVRSQPGVGSTFSVFFPLPAESR
ncbi:sensor histidine kinase [Hymenobacter sp. GOD-10R]|uniref:sensor histidine kinase n=1 Tax=Hymenobacter sp. GOD-10R TaxID=3093922 RepID=UPI002D7A13E7|nr:PAS domain-containing protein [Hymenobacter sp. GOD-10R]WRQ26141.1 PAS domain-containing protein [Hymenobacter sp. GOD-10R]